MKYIKLCSFETMAWKTQLYKDEKLQVKRISPWKLFLPIPVFILLCNCGKSKKNSDWRNCKDWFDALLLTLKISVLYCICEMTRLCKCRDETVNMFVYFTGTWMLPVKLSCRSSFANMKPLASMSQIRALHILLCCRNKSSYTKRGSKILRL